MSNLREQLNEFVENALFDNALWPIDNGMAEDYIKAEDVLSGTHVNE